MQDRPWHVLHVTSKHEKQVARHLAIRSVEHYLPLYRETVRWTDRTVVTERPLFAGYLFARVRPENHIAVVSIPGLLRVLGDKEHLTVSAQELEKIRLGLATNMVLRQHATPALGEMVRVRNGVFSGAQGIVEKLTQKCRVVLTLTGTCQHFSVEFDAGDLEPLGETAGSPGFEVTIESGRAAGGNFRR